MRRIILCLVLVPLVLSLNAQKGNPSNSGKKTVQRCATDQYLQKLLARDPGLKARLEAAEASLSRGMDEKLQARKRQGNMRTNAIITIPVVVHIILENPNTVTDADVLWQINKMNIDFAGQNADSVKAGAFAPLFGHSSIQFCLAQRDPIGNPTTGIQRVSSSLTWDQNNFNDIKYASNCGSGAWDPNQYFNIWVAESVDGTLGVATFPTSGQPLEQGIVIAHEAFGNNPAYVSFDFNLGRTAVHETGHFFFARHIWGDGGGCQSDFPVVSGLTGSWVDDTPAQSSATTGCPTGTLAAGCGSPNPPGKMYQNYMDYTNDACYCMFTINQVLRMETALDVFRASLKTSSTCTPAIIFTNDASIAAIINPFEGNGCAPANNTQCDPNLTPVVTLKNFGSVNLTSATIYTQIDAGTPTSFGWTGNLAPNATTNVTLPVVAAAPGTHTLKMYVVSPNGAADGRLTNDTLTSSFTILVPVTIPVTQGFESATFPPAGWYIADMNLSGLTWERTTLAAKTGVASATMRFYDYSNGTDDVDYILSRPITVTANQQLVLSFDRAYRLFSTDPDFADSLAVVISYDCGETFTEIWKRGGAALATVSGALDDAFVPGANEWASTFVNLGPWLITDGNVIVGFKATNRYGNNLYIDNINIDNSGAIITDALISGVESPFTHECDREVAPMVTLLNNGNDTLKKVSIVLVLDNVNVGTIQWTGSIAPGNEQNVPGQSFNITSAGNHSFAAYTRLPNDLPDSDTFNDTAKLDFIVHDPQELPVEESFEGAAFPPANWSLFPSGSAYTWEKTNRAATHGINSAWIRNYRFSSNGKHDDLHSPLLKAGEFDSLIVTFDLAHARVTPVTDEPDTLEVLLTKDCGHTFESIYKKWGNTLQTTGNPPPTFPITDTVGFVPGVSQWRREHINFTSRVAPNTEFMLVFRNTSNRGNNTFLDSITIERLVLPERLKRDGFIIRPNPFPSSFEIWHLVAPTGLRAVVVTNTSGQIVYTQHFRGTAGNSIKVDLGRYASGMYNVKLVYSYNTVNVKLIKR
jgi:hypothetical protein